MGFWEFFKNNTTERQYVCEDERNKRILAKEATADKIRMIYIAIEKYNSSSDSRPRLRITHNTTSPYFIPEGMSIQDAYKVISYISEKIEREYNKTPASNNSVAYTTYTLERYGFKKAGNSNKTPETTHRNEFFTGKGAYIYEKESPNTMELYTVGGDYKEFEKSNLYNNYFEWFTPNVKEQEIENIYDKIGIELPCIDPHEPII